MKIKAYNATGELDIGNHNIEQRDDFILGTRVLLSCEVTGLQEEDEVDNYRWYHNCTGGTQGRCQIQDRDPYYRIVNDNLLLDVISWEQGGTYTCFVKLNITSGDSTPKITVTDYCMHHKYWGQHGALHHWSPHAYVGNPVPFLYTPTSLLPEHSVLTDVQQATGKNVPEWITCSSGRQNTTPTILMGNGSLVPSNTTAGSATIGLDSHHPNGLYHCLIAETLRKFSLYLSNSGKLYNIHQVHSCTCLITRSSILQSLYQHPL